MTFPQPTLTLVLGMHRSGTSLIASLIQSLGVPFGDKLMPPGRDNPKGFFEDMEVVDFNDRVLRYLGLDWKALQTPSVDILAYDLPKHFYQDGHELLQDRIDAFGNFGLKDPRICRLLPFWRRIVTMLNIPVKGVIVIRHPFAIAASLFKRDQMDLNVSLELWYRTMLECSSFMPPSWERLVVDYDSAVSYTPYELARLERFLGKEPHAAPSVKPNQADESLRHTFFKGVDRLEPPYRDLWVALFKQAHLDTNMKENFEHG